VIEHLDEDGGGLLGAYRLAGKPDALRAEGLFAVEGRLLLPRLLASRYRTHSVLCSDVGHESLAELTEAHPDVRVIVAPADVISDLAGYKFHRGCLALGYRRPPDSIDEVLPGLEAGARKPVLILEGVSNPDNIGGIFRSAHAFGARAVLMGPGSGDPLYRKAIRTSVGATLDMPWTTLADWPGSLDDIRGRGYRLVALTPDAAAPALREIVARDDDPIAFVLGSEGHGLSPAALAHVSTTARIPMHPGTDSLNVASAASIALYEASAR
jgi:tRNA G18 (ribose-2'-O)-methylase SpoU